MLASDAPAAAATKPVFAIEHRASGYAHEKLGGTYTGAATSSDVQAQFYHPLFGGRDAWAVDGRWGCVTYTD